MIKTIIIDGEHTARVYLENILKTNFSDRVVVKGTFSSVKEASEKVNINDVDLMFVGLKKGNNGFDAIDFNVNSKLALFITAEHTVNTLRALKSAAMDYIEKPLRIENILQAINRVNSQKRQLNERLQSLQKSLSVHKVLEYAFRFEDGFKIVELEQVEYIEAVGKSTNFVMRNGEVILVNKPKKRIISDFGHDIIIDVDTPYAVNKSCVVNVDINASKMSLTSGKEVSISNRRLPYVKGDLGL